MKIARGLAFVLISFVLIACQAPAQPAQSEIATLTEVPLPEATATVTLAPDQLINLAQDASNRGDWQSAILALDLALAQNPIDTQALLLRGNAYRELGDYAQSLDNYNQALGIDPELAAVYHNRALTY